MEMPVCPISSSISLSGVLMRLASVANVLDRMQELQKLWDDALVDAAKANAAKENTAEDGGVQEQARRKYWRPELNEDEWNLLNRRMEKRTRQRQTIS